MSDVAEKMKRLNAGIGALKENGDAFEVMVLATKKRMWVRIKR